MFVTESDTPWWAEYPGEIKDFLERLISRDGVPVPYFFFLFVFFCFNFKNTKKKKRHRHAPRGG